MSCYFEGLSFFKENDYSIQFVFLFSFINLQIVLSFLAAAFFSKVNTAQGIKNCAILFPCASYCSVLKDV
jgi:hypothetical protein